MTQIGPIKMVDPTRATFNDSLAAKDIDVLVRDPKLKVLQCWAPVRDSVWILLNERFFAMRPDVQLRVFGFFGSECDLSFASKMGNVRRFSADCIMNAKNVEAIATIPNLESLSLGIFELKDFGVLKLIPATVTSLSLHATKSRRPSLAPLRRLRPLRTLYLEGQSNDIEVIAELQDLEDITLRSITTPDLSYLSPLGRLWSLDIKLGGIRSFAGVEGKESIKYLELWQVRELKNVEIVAALPGLQNLLLQSLPNIESFPSLGHMSALRRVLLENMKGMRDFSSFEYAPILEEFLLVDGRTQIPEQLLPVLRNPAVRIADAGFGSSRKNQAFSKLRDKQGKLGWDRFIPFAYC
jgi:hypothetical protein